jgi:hypothetical protein
MFALLLLPRLCSQLTHFAFRPREQNQVTSILEQFTGRWSNLVAENEDLRKENELLRNIDF